MTPAFECDPADDIDLVERGLVPPIEPPEAPAGADEPPAGPEFEIDHVLVQIVVARRENGCKTGEQAFNCKLFSPIEAQIGPALAQALAQARGQAGG